MSSKLGEAIVPIRATLEELDKDLKGARSKISSALGGLSGSIANVGKKAFIGFTAGLTALGTGLVIAGKTAIDFGADANETASLLDTSLGPAAANLNNELSDFADAANRSFYELQEGSSTFVAMTRSMGATQDQAADLGVSFTKAATDLGSFFNVNTEDALLDIQSALAGSSETMTKYGIDIRETTLKQMALDQGLIQSATETLPQLVRAQLIQQAITEQGADAMGDAIRTSDSWSNTMRGLKGRLRDVTTEAGQKLIPALMPLLSVVGDLAEQAVPILSTALDKAAPIIELVATTVQTLFSNLQAGMEPLDAITIAIETLLGAEAAAWFQDAMAAIQEFIFTVQEAIQPITDWFQSNVELTDNLIALGIAIGVMVIPALISMLAPILAIIAIGAALVAAISIVRQAWENDWGGIRTKLTEAWEGTIRPALEMLWAWLSVNVPAALETLRAWWVDTAWPAIQATIETVWPIIESIFTALSDFIVNTLIPTITELYTNWTEVWWPAIQTVLENVWTVIETIFTEIGRWINDNLVPWVEYFQEQWQANFEMAQSVLETVWGILLPIFETIQLWLQENIPAAVETLRSMWESSINPLKQPVEDALSAIENLWDALKGFWSWISSKVFEFDFSIPDIPDWAKPGSPLPIHTAWVNFDRAMRNIQIAPQLNFAGVPGMDGPDNGATAPSTMINIDARGTDVATVERLRKIIREEISRAGREADYRIRT